ncbi:MAG: DUF72 domain-containing protein [Candidatus Thermoplasmatota archaeon]|nr:DUF72 domain-containing protein [Candidatus Thermoplasmatota archaeon]
MTLEGIDLKVGTSGWSYPDWVGPFYPKGTPSGEMLARYAAVFDTVEVNSSFYAIPPRDRVASWAKAVPDGFTFSLKVPKAVTHEARLDPTPEVLDTLDGFHTNIRALGTRVEALLLQLPPSLDVEEGLPRLERLLDIEPFPAPVALEARHATWASAEAFELLRDHDVTWVWSENQHWETPAKLTTDRAYVRFIGDREIERFHKIQREVEPSLTRWEQRLAERHDELTAATVYANNHFAGFGPGTANAFLRAAGREPRRWSGGAGNREQRGLDEFL